MADSRKSDARFPPVSELTESAVRSLERIDTNAQNETETNRVKTRFLGFNSTSEPESGEQCRECQAPAEQPEVNAPLARLVIVQGAGRGKSFALSDNFYRIGRSAGQEIQLAFGDKFVSRKNHASIAHYGGRYGFEIRDGGKANPVLLNGRKLWRSENLKNGDLIQLGTTTLRFFDLSHGEEAITYTCPPTEPNSTSQTASGLRP